MNDFHLLRNGNCSPRLSNGDAGCGCEGAAQVVENGAPVGLGGADDGAEGGIGVRAPFGAKAVCHLSEDDAGTQRALGAVVGGRHGAVGDEDEQMRALAGDAAAQFLGDLAAARQCHQAVQPAVQIGAILCQRAVAQRLPSSPDGDGTQ